MADREDDDRDREFPKKFADSSSSSNGGVVDDDSKYANPQPSMNSSPSPQQAKVPRKNKKTPAEKELSLRKPDSVDDEEVIEAAKFAVNEHNKTLEKQNHLIFERVMKVNTQVVVGFMLYMTLEVKERQGNENEERSFYEAKVYLGINRHIALEFLRPAIHFKG
ncbi:hypothetical protein FEM48_Zijuj02G0012300 [Ziziphus jujuba var. spinosa]|uniref:Cysteine proteinase inhibitor n=1 Tax=Ziziphus jujuba var. spinosa TaxID=714518 RepID=A0A978VSR5_ZIZJJ|nr:hypothetical protein FEM48_Zijuj02G0012300 [Ziziphus jujuba var. spinosa]